MKYANAMYGFNPVGGHKPEADQGRIEVGPHPDRSGWSRCYQSKLGSINLEEKHLRGADLVARIFLDFHTIVVGGGLNPQTVHLEFLKIDEYRWAISPEIEGAEEPE